ncbi:HU family DNA-binding protein [Endothiovibrio diazotrophicus]
MAALNGTDLIALVATATELPQDVVNRVLDATSNISGERVRAGDKVTIPHIGSFEYRAPRARRYRSQQTGEMETSITKPGCKFTPKRAWIGG